MSEPEELKVVESVTFITNLRTTVSAGFTMYAMDKTVI